MHMFLVIKGDRADAMRAARLRKVELTIEGYSAHNNETYCHALMGDEPKIIAWYCEDRGIASPAQRGDCLWYATREAKP
jgi:hypothetical protein